MRLVTRLIKASADLYRKLAWKKGGAALPWVQQFADTADKKEKSR